MQTTLHKCISFLLVRKLKFLHICILLVPSGGSNTPHKSECQTSLNWVTTKPTTNKTPSTHLGQKTVENSQQLSSKNK